jgi:hypothetical protein
MAGHLSSYVQSLGSYYISMQEPEKALELVQTSVSKWFRAKAEEVDLEEIEQELVQDEVGWRLLPHIIDCPSRATP